MPTGQYIRKPRGSYIKKDSWLRDMGFFSILAPEIAIQLEKYFPGRFAGFIRENRHAVTNKDVQELGQNGLYGYTSLARMSIIKRFDPHGMQFDPEKMGEKRHGFDIIRLYKHDDACSRALILHTVIPFLESIGSPVVVAMESLGCKQADLFREYYSNCIWLPKWKGVYNPNNDRGDLVVPEDIRKKLCTKKRPNSEDIVAAHELTHWYKPYVKMRSSVDRYKARMGESLNYVLGPSWIKDQHIIIWDDSAMTGFSTLFVNSLLESCGIPLNHIHSVAAVLEGNALRPQ
jgi:hypothetical protein